MASHPAPGSADTIAPGRTRAPRALAALLILLLALAGAMLAAAAKPAQAAVTRPFTPAPRFAINTTGDISAIGNTLMTCSAAASGCTSARSGSGTLLNNNDYSMVRIDLDGTADPSTFNHTSAQLTAAHLPAGAEVLWAGLYWGAQTPTTVNPAIGLDPALRDRVRLAVPGGTFETVTATFPSTWNCSAATRPSRPTSACGLRTRWSADHEVVGGRAASRRLRVGARPRASDRAAGSRGGRGGQSQAVGSGRSLTTRTTGSADGAMPGDKRAAVSRRCQPRRVGPSWGHRAAHAPTPAIRETRLLAP